MKIFGDTYPYCGMKWPLTKTIQQLNIHYLECQLKVLMEIKASISESIGR